MISFKAAEASQYLVITGRWIEDIKVAKKAWILPGQSCTVIDLSPVNYAFQVQAMSADKLPFTLPAVFTVGPRTEDKESLYNYAKLMSSHDKRWGYVTQLVEREIEGVTRRLAARMIMEDIIKGAKFVMEQVFEILRLELFEFGLCIYYADVEQLVGIPGHDYFSDLGQKVQMEAANQEVMKKNVLTTTEKLKAE